MALTVLVLANPDDKTLDALGSIGADVELVVGDRA